MARKDGPTAAKVIASWALLETTALATTEGPRLWDEHWTMVRKLRRSFTLLYVTFGLLFGTLAATGSFLMTRQWELELLFVLILVLAGPVVLGAGARRVAGATVAPLVPRPRHLWSGWIAVLLYELVLFSGFLVERNGWWALAGGVLTGLPLWVAAALENRPKIPAFPNSWRQFIAS